LRSVFGLSSLRPGQLAVIESVLAGSHTLAIMPTGAGKSLCYQVPALLMPGMTVVISPLIALMPALGEPAGGAQCGTCDNCRGTIRAAAVAQGAA
jgi:hypothetical protein